MTKLKFNATIVHVVYCKSMVIETKWRKKSEGSSEYSKHLRHAQKTTDTNYQL